MVHLGNKVREYREYIEKVKESNIYIDYIDLLGCEDEEALAKVKKLEQTAVMRKFSRINNYLKVIDNPFDNTFFERYIKFIKMNFDKKSLNNSKECFEDGIPMKLWFEALVYNYQAGNLTTYYSEKVEHLQKLIYEKNLARDISYCITKLQITLGLSDEKLADFLGISNYLVNAMKNEANNISITSWNGLISSMEGSVKDNFSTDVFLIINELIHFLKQRINELELEEQQKSNVDLKSIKDKLDSYMKIFLEGDLKKAFNCCINGYRFADWWKEYWTVNVKQLEQTEEINEIVKKYNNLIEALYSTKLMYSELNNEDTYGYSLSKFLLSIGLNKKEFAERIGIPTLFVAKILNNDFCPDLAMINKILQFLNDWKCENEYQTKFLLETKETFLLYKNGEVKYNIYDLNRLSEYESYMIIDQDLKEFIKENDFDWYVKCVTYNYILNTVGTPSVFDYFYDGVCLERWFLSQKMSLGRTKEKSLLSKKQGIMFKCLRDKKAKLIDENCKLKDVKSKEIELFNNFRLLTKGY